MNTEYRNEKLAELEPLAAFAHSVAKALGADYELTTAAVNGWPADKPSDYETDKLRNSWRIYHKPSKGLLVVSYANYEKKRFEVRILPPSGKETGIVGYQEIKYTDEIKNADDYPHPGPTATFALNRDPSQVARKIIKDFEPALRCYYPLYLAKIDSDDNQAAAFKKRLTGLQTKYGFKFHDIERAVKDHSATSYFRGELDGVTDYGQFKTSIGGSSTFEIRLSNERETDEFLALLKRLNARKNKKAANNG